MKYFRYYPWGLQLLLFMLMTFTLSSFSIWCLGILTPKLTGITLEMVAAINEQSSFEVVKIGVYFQGISSIFIFAVPPLLFAYLTHPRPLAYIGLRKPGKAVQPILAILLMCGAMPLLMGIEALVSQIDFGMAVKQSQARSESLTKAFLYAPAFTDFIRIFIVMAIIPAVGEELFFRGIMLRFTTRALISSRLKTGHAKAVRVAIVLVAMLFASFHSNIYGLVSIFIAGILLAYIYFLTNSIWCSILAHLCFNGSQVTLNYLANTNPAIKALMNSNVVPVWLLISGAVVFSVSLYLLIKNKTPLPDNWTNDFDEPEPPVSIDKNEGNSIPFEGVE